jgi:hypothetical protein
MAKGCARCNSFDRIGVDGQSFYVGDELEYSVTKARAIIEANPREAIDVPVGAAAEALYNADISLRHVRHVDIRFPSIVVKHKRKYLFIDGNHRAFARFTRKLPIKAYLLTPRETRVILSSK